MQAPRPGHRPLGVELYCTPSFHQWQTIGWVIAHPVYLPPSPKGYGLYCSQFHEPHLEIVLYWVYRFLGSSMKLISFAKSFGMSVECSSWFMHTYMPGWCWNRWAHRSPHELKKVFRECSCLLSPFPFTFTERIRWIREPAVWSTYPKKLYVSLTCARSRVQQAKSIHMSPRYKLSQTSVVIVWHQLRLH